MDQKQNQKNGASETFGTMAKGLALMLLKSQKTKSKMLKICLKK